MRKSRIFLVSLVVLSVCCYSVCALPRSGASKAESSPSYQVVVEEEPAHSVPVPTQVLEPQQGNTSTQEQVVTSQTLSELRTDLETTSRMNKKDISELISKLEAVSNDIDLMKLDAEDKEARIVELEDDNKKQAEEIVRATSTKPFTFLSGMVSLEDGKPILSVGGQMGVRFGSSLMVSVGGFYDIGDWNQPQIVKAKDNVHFIASIGWEW